MPHALSNCPKIWNFPRHRKKNIYGCLIMGGGHSTYVGAMQVMQNPTCFSSHIHIYDCQIVIHKLCDTFACLTLPLDWGSSVCLNKNNQLLNLYSKVWLVVGAKHNCEYSYIKVWTGDKLRGIWNNMCYAEGLQKSTFFVCCFLK